MKEISTKIITHRGLDPSKEGFFAESSLEAFEDYLERGFGIEFDLQFTKDAHMVALHDKDLSRITKKADSRYIGEVTLAELLAMEIGGSHIATIEQVFDLIEKKAAPDALNAFHIKHLWQDREHIDQLLSFLSARDTSKLILFDLKPDIAAYIKEARPELSLAASVAHSHDVARYNGAVGGTLVSVEEFLKMEAGAPFSWAWLDEWDLADKDGKQKTLYNKEVFERLREAGFKIALVTPELHATSPGLLGGESHFDAKDFATLSKRLREIADLKPDAMCTDYPDFGLSLVRP